jgi:regulator-associated protein of mTOR
VWDYKGDTRGKERANLFRNDNPPGTRISSLHVVNDRQDPLLLCGSDDGVVRLWKNADCDGGQALVTAWTVHTHAS